MVHTLTTPAATPSGNPVRPRGLLALASPAPDGWESGGIETSRTCADPVVRDKCITFEATPARSELAQFPAFIVEQGSACSTISGSDRMAEASEALATITEWALGRTLYDGIANDGAPSLADAVDLGSFSGALAALSALECAAAETGQEYTLHTTVGAAGYLGASGLIDDAGRAPSGALWIISPGYPCEEPLRIWATGRVWAAAGAITTREAVNRRTNNREGWADRAAIVGFNTCVNLTASFTPSAGGGGVDPETEARIVALETETTELQSEVATLGSDVSTLGSDVSTLETTVAGKADEVHTHAAADVTTGTFSTARIPSLSISKTTGLQAELDSKVESVAAGTGIAVDATDPQNPVVSTTA